MRYESGIHKVRTHSNISRAVAEINKIIGCHPKIGIGLAKKHKAKAKGQRWVANIIPSSWVEGIPKRILMPKAQYTINLRAQRSILVHHTALTHRSIASL